MSRQATGRPKGTATQKPTEQKRRLGNPGQRPLPASVAVPAEEVAIPDPPRPLDVAGRVVWDRCWRGASRWLDNRTDIEVVLILCEQCDERDQLRTRVLRDGERFERAALRSIDAQIMAGLCAIGFTPTDRARLGIGDSTEIDQLDELRRRRPA